MIGIIGIVLAIIFLMVGSYKGLSALPLTLLASLIVIVTNVMNLWESLATLYMNGYVGTYLNYFLIFCCSSLYAHVMTEIWQYVVYCLSAPWLVWQKARDSGVHYHRSYFDIWRCEFVCGHVCCRPNSLYHVSGGRFAATPDCGGAVCRFLHLYHDLLARQPAVDKYYSLSVSGYSSDGCSCVWLHCSSGTVFDGLCILRILREKSAEEWGTLVFSEKF